MGKGKSLVNLTSVISYIILESVLLPMCMSRVAYPFLLESEHNNADPVRS